MNIISITQVMIISSSNIVIDVNIHYSFNEYDSEYLFKDYSEQRLFNICDLINILGIFI